MHLRSFIAVTALFLVSCENDPTIQRMPQVISQSHTVGDTLFVQGCGRIDLPGAEPEEMYRTLTERLSGLPDDVVLYPGHDYGDQPTSTLGEERRTNTSLRIPTLDEWMRLMGC